MAAPYFCGPTLDDVMRSVIEEIQTSGERINPSKGECVELAGVLLELTDPRARISRTETRGKPFSCLGELCWYLAGSNDLDYIYYYIPAYSESAEDGMIFGGYGPRLFNWEGLDQWGNVAALLRRKPSSRRAVIQLFDAFDIVEKHKDVPCTCVLQFMVRDQKLNMLASMRSNDVILGLPHDVFTFTMFQEIMARALSLEIGTYKHFVGSLHLYEKHRDDAQKFLDEGWQSTEKPMPPMPEGDPWPAIKSLLQAESAIRTGGLLDAEGIKDLDLYWVDLIRLLQVLRFSRDKEPGKIEELGGQISSSIYRVFIDKKLDECRRRLG